MGLPQLVRQHREGVDQAPRVLPVVHGTHGEDERPRDAQHAQELRDSSAIGSVRSGTKNRPSLAVPMFTTRSGDRPSKDTKSRRHRFRDRQQGVVAPQPGQALDVAVHELGPRPRGKYSS